MVRRIDAAAGIAVDVPGAADLGILLDDGVGDAEPAERDAKRDGADAGADNQHMLFGELFVRRTLAPAHFARDEAHLFAHQRGIFRCDILAECGAHHRQHQFVAGVGDHGLRLALFEQFQHGSADLVLDLLWHAGVGIGDQPHVALWLVGWLQPAHVAGHVHQHHQEHADVALGDGGGEIVLLAGAFDIHIVHLNWPAAAAGRHRRPRSRLRESRNRPAN